jgi:hypothetical protein
MTAANDPAFLRQPHNLRFHERALFIRDLSVEQVGQKRQAIGNPAITVDNIVAHATILVGTVATEQKVRLPTVIREQRCMDVAELRDS